MTILNTAIPALLGAFGLTVLAFPRIRCFLGFHDWDHEDRIAWELHEGKERWYPTRCKRCPARQDPKTVDYL